MKELKDILNAYDKSVVHGRRTSLASVVHLDGSAYRRPGARMLVNDEGEMFGAISGGCLEGDALRKAMQVIIQGQSRLVTYDTSDEDDVTVGVQLGCEGIIRVLFEPIDPERPDNPISLIRKAVRVRQHAMLVTLFDAGGRNSPQPGTCILLETDDSTTGNAMTDDFSPDILTEARRLLQERRSGFLDCYLKDRTITAFFEHIQPVVSLVIVGAGNDAIPLMHIASTLGWDVRVVDGRATHASVERFESACQVLVTRPEAVLDQIPMDERTVFVMMTHNYHYDLAMLKALLPTPVPYIGMLGPKKKLHRMLEELAASGMVPDNDMLHRIYGPAGLEIGAETPEEIALSIISEIQAVMNHKNGGMLREKAAPIHAASSGNI